MLIPGKTACKEGNGILSDVDDDDLRFEDARQGGGDHTRLEDPRHQELGVEQLGYQVGRLHYRVRVRHGGPHRGVSAAQMGSLFKCQKHCELRHMVIRILQIVDFPEAIPPVNPIKNMI